jgi:hypothetical protein
LKKKKLRMSPSPPCRMAGRRRHCRLQPAGRPFGSVRERISVVIGTLRLHELLARQDDPVRDISDYVFVKRFSCGIKMNLVSALEKKHKDLMAT